MVKPPLKPFGAVKGGDIDGSIQILSPTKEILKIRGKLSYSESSGAWNVLKIKKDILKIFPQLRDKNNKFAYHMIIPSSPDEAKKKFEELKELKDMVPILLFFEKDAENISD